MAAITGHSGCDEEAIPDARLAPDRLPMSLTVPVEDFCGHLSALRRSPTQSGGYRADLIDLMGHAHSHGDDTLGRIGTSQVRAWLADTRVAGASAATMQRRWSAARYPKRLPATLGVDQARHILDEAVAQLVHDESPHGARDAAILEVLYGGGLRVGELCGLDLSDVDRSRRTVKVTGKGDKERTVPMGAPALRAIDTWLPRREEWVGPHSGQALFLGARGRRIDHASFGESFTPTCVPNQTPPTLGLTGDASWVTPLYHLVVVLCERDGTLVVVHPGREFQVVGTFSSKANGLATVPSIPTGRLMAVADYASAQVEFVDLSDPTRPTVRNVLDLGQGCVFPRPVADRQEGPHAHQVTWLDRAHLAVNGSRS
ncbi:unnamed protein product [Cylicocyclus nassatus]|uniref:Tyr recombinase domain-containing protein n=1 Tax=Cylicocyclus nassatus TaxID=53992 RepID=A0AA36GZ36_CYLNA|nr:unnamed protein product [Cylicocyclus nassatus]